ncbi:PTPRT-like protein [Mya arenaria]|uniref:protein-tyrosine-phosphatase n=1 Tax=Mya arenaria TaxID=6604 RepID=A0ABY7DMP2_MYAAR|nr:PTPRT-like protein [Mya arenaria]
MHYNTRRLSMYSLLLSLIAMSVLRDSLETVTEIDVIAFLKNTSVPPLVTGSKHWSDWSPDKIIDGNNGDGDANQCKCCAALYRPAWASLDLNSPFLLSRIKVFGRTDGSRWQSENLIAYIGDSSMGYQNLTQLNTPDRTKTGLLIHLDPPRLAQYITFKKPNDDFMAICEVEVLKTDLDIISSGMVNPLVNQSSQYMRCNAEKAIDRLLFISNDQLCETCSATSGNEPPQWQLDLGRKVLLQGYRIYGRMSALVKDQQTFPFGAVAGGVVGVLCGAAVIVGLGFFFYRRRTRKPPTTKSSQTYEKAGFGTPTLNVSNASKNISAQISGVVHTTDADNQYYEFGNFIPGIQLHNLWDYIRDNKKNECQHFNDEFAKLPTGPVHQHNVAEREEYKGKNRYREMYACPTKNMIDDFWRMVWQENAEKIVKCLQYWPEMDQTCSFGGIDISVTGVEEFRDYEIRTIIAKKAQSDSRRIHQYHFKAWPDKDVPDNGWCLVEFLNAVEAQSTNAPFIVHCSAGIGRTGTFIALDNLVDQARTEKCVRPLQMVEALRRQRVNMVQTKDQYVYLHEALAEALLMGTDHVWNRQFEEVHPFMMATEPGEKQTRMVKQFQLIEQSLTNEAQQMQDGPEYGNMETIISEIDAYRPKLKKRGSNFTQQLDAILLPGFCGNNTFLMCKSPREEQLEEFWSLVEEQHVITVIMLTSSSSRAHQTCVYMGGNGDGKVGRYSVNFIQEWKNKTFNERSFSFRDDNNEGEDNLTTVKQFQFTAWTENESLPPVQNMLDCLDDVRKWQPHLAENRAVLIHCESNINSFTIHFWNMSRTQLYMRTSKVLKNGNDPGTVVCWA